MKGSRRLVIDASVASAAGDVNATHTTSKSCRDFLQAVLSICHRAVFPPQLIKEWKKHASRFAQTWQVAMERRQKLDWIEPGTDDEIHETIAEIAASEKDKAAMEKDAFLLEAAQATTDRMVAPLDEIARDLFRELAGHLPRIGKIVWINPGREEELVLAWLRSGAKPESPRGLGSRPKRKK
ncbi:MAG: hypothetical protein ACRELF_05320 [Gemmataceae bacterium]